jgi:hypothetical protein
MSNDIVLTPQEASDYATYKAALARVGGDHARIRVQGLGPPRQPNPTVTIDVTMSLEERWGSIQAQVGQQQKEQIVRERTDTPPGEPISPARTMHVFRPIEDRLVKAIAIAEGMLSEGDDPDNNASSTVGTAVTLKLADLKQALATVRELIAVGSDEPPSLPERVQKLDALLKTE